MHVHTTSSDPAAPAAGPLGHHRAAVAAGPVADAKTLRRAFGTFATGVTVMTVGGDTPHAMTANSFTTVSLDPPLVLVCIDRTAVMHSVLADAGHFAISVLAADQAGVAAYFADRNRPLGAAQFDNVDCRPGPVTGAPLVAGALSHFECEVSGSFDGGDHTVFVARILSLHRAEQATEQAEALLFLGGRFRHLHPEAAWPGKEAGS